MTSVSFRSVRRLSLRLSATGAALAIVALASVVTPRTATPRFFDDDPLQVEPETQDASKVQEWDIDLVIDLATNLFSRPGDPTPDVRALSANTVDEVPDSSWFTNRIGAKPLSVEEVVRGPMSGDGPADGRWTVIRAKQAGFAPGFTMRDIRGETWFVSFDARGFPEAATGAVMAATKIFWALGYYQVDTRLIHIDPGRLDIAPSAKVRPPSGVRRAMRRRDLDDVFAKAQRSADGSYRAVAGRAVPGRVVGGFRYHGTRPDDPNDVIPHEHRRELRALKVFGAWTNLVDMKAGNTLDTVVEVGGQHRVRHYLQDVGSTFGAGALGYREFEEGWEYLFEGKTTLRRSLTFGIPPPNWARIRYDERPGIGRFEGERFDPLAWKPRVPTAAFLRARADDNFWAARRVAAFSDEMIRAIATTAQFSDPQATKQLADVLIARRDRIARTYLPAVNPIVNVSLSGEGVLSFENAGVTAGVVAAPRGYLVAAAVFDNATGTTAPLGDGVKTAEGRVRLPFDLPKTVGVIVRIEIQPEDLDPAPRPPIEAFFRLGQGGWRLIGLQRMP
jgi:hypothetical protein